MKIIYNSIIPFKGFVCINLFGMLFVRHENKDMLNKYIINHEAIHSEQQKELLYIGFYIWYFFEWLYRLCTVKNGFKNHIAYHAISFEVEAYDNQDNLDYIKTRKRFSWLKK